MLAKHLTRWARRKHCESFNILSLHPINLVAVKPFHTQKEKEIIPVISEVLCQPHASLQKPVLVHIFSQILIMLQTVFLQRFSPKNPFVVHSPVQHTVYLPRCSV